MAERRAKIRVGFIGAGKMATALMASLIRSKACPRRDVRACDISAARRRFVKRGLGIAVYDRIEPVVRGSSVVFLAVKPQDFGVVLPAMAPHVARRHLVVSIAAGRRTAAIEAVLPRARVVRVMPNLNCRVFAGMSAFCLGTRAGETDRRLVARLLACSGKTIELPEELFDVVTALSGSGPAFFACFADAVADAATRAGLSRETAVMLAEQTMYGTAKLLLEEGLDPAELIASVSSKGGTTVAGMDVLRTLRVRPAIAAAIRAAARRSRELSR